MILAGDIGGTKTVLGLFSGRSGRLEMETQATVASAEHSSLEEILGPFLAEQGSPAIEAASFAVAGPVVDGVCRTTNLPWVLEEERLAEILGGAPVRLLNDLEGTAFGMLYLPPEQIVELQPGRVPPRSGHVAVIAAGTGLGEAYLYWDGRRHHPVASEGGHADFAPRTDEEVDLLLYLRERLGGRVSWERVLSGAGLGEIYAFLRDTGRFREPQWLAERMAGGDAGALISEASGPGGEDICIATMEIFAELYGAEAGNMALRALTWGGVFVGGGIAAKNLGLLRSGAFLRGFSDKGRFTELMADIPVRVSTNPETALLGAAHHAWAGRSG
jgi:glucokinase